MLIIINLIVLLYIFWQFKLICESNDRVLVKAMKQTVEIDAEQKKALNLIIKIVDTLNKSIYEMSSLNKISNTIHTDTMELKHLNKQFTDNINTNAKTLKESIHVLKRRNLELLTITNKLKNK